MPYQCVKYLIVLYYLVDKYLCQIIAIFYIVSILAKNVGTAFCMIYV